MYSIELPEEYNMFLNAVAALNTHEERLALCDITIKAVQESMEDPEEAMGQLEELRELYDTLKAEGVITDNENPLFYLLFTLEHAMGSFDKENN